MPSLIASKITLPASSISGATSLTNSEICLIALEIPSLISPLLFIIPWQIWCIISLPMSNTLLNPPCVINVFTLEIAVCIAPVISAFFISFSKLSNAFFKLSNVYKAWPFSVSPLEFPLLQILKKLANFSDAPWIAGFNASNPSIATSCKADDNTNNLFLVVSSIASAIFSDKPVTNFKLSQYILNCSSDKLQISFISSKESDKPKLLNVASLVDSSIPLNLFLNWVKLAIKSICPVAALLAFNPYSFSTAFASFKAILGLNLSIISCLLKTPFNFLALSTIPTVFSFIMSQVAL